MLLAPMPATRAPVFAAGGRCHFIEGCAARRLPGQPSFLGLYFAGEARYRSFLVGAPLLAHLRAPRNGLGFPGRPARSRLAAWRWRSRFSLGHIARRRRQPSVLDGLEGARLFFRRRRHHARRRRLIFSPTSQSSKRTASLTNKARAAGISTDARCSTIASHYQQASHRPFAKPCAPTPCITSIDD